MIGLADRLVRPLLARIDPERAHRLAVTLMRHAPVPRPAGSDATLLVEAFGLRFPNPLGLAAGFDKDGALGEAALAFGFGFTEVGTLTPAPQPGNPPPRVFRLPGDRAIVNRYGFNNGGQAAAAARLAKRRRRGIVGVNVGANKDSPDRVADYVAGIRFLAPHADFFTLNVSSPNTPGLRDLQAAAALDDLLARAIEARDVASAAAGRVPLLLKIAPDVDDRAIDAIVACARHRGIDGMIVSNTTLARPGSLRSPAMREAGGLSGRPLFALATRVLAKVFVRVEGRFPLVGAGGIDSPETALTKIRAGASLVQLYSGLVYEGLGLVGRIDAHLRTVAGEAGGLSTLVGTDAADWSREASPV